MQKNAYASRKPITNDGMLHRKEIALAIALVTEPLTSQFGNLRDYLRLNLADQQSSDLHILYFDEDDKLVEHTRYSQPLFGDFQGIAETIVTRSDELSAIGIVLSRCGSNGETAISGFEAETRLYQIQLNSAKVQLIDYIVVHPDQCISASACGWVHETPLSSRSLLDSPA